MNTISVAVINIIDGTPDPYNINDSIAHMGGQIHFDWVNIYSIGATMSLEYGGRPTHYVIHNEHLHLVGDSSSIVQQISNAMAITRDTILDLHKKGIRPEGEVEVNNCGIYIVDLDVDDGEVLFKLEEHPDIWIHALWRH